jgi:NitT/TauT family transport system permease protein
MYAALGASLLRLFGAYILSILVGIPLGLLAERSRRFEAFFLPLYDVLESMPVLAFFPVIILFFLQAGWLEGAAIFIIFFSMVWDIAFSVIGGNKVIPKDVQAIGTVFELSRFKRLTTITLPSIFPQLITGSILALANGWNIVIVAEALHAYAPLSLAAQDLFGIGSILVLAASQSDTLTLLTAMGILIGAIALINIAVWQPLLGYSERFKFE